MRPRICMAIITATPSGSIVRRETKAQLEASQRRAKFERDRKKLRIAVVGKEPIPVELISFNNNVANAIVEFKKSKQQR